MGASFRPHLDVLLGDGVTVDIERPAIAALETVQNFGRRNASEISQRVLFWRVQWRDGLRAGPFGFHQGRIASPRSSAFDDGAVEQPRRQGRDHHALDILRTGRLAPYGDIARIATERGNIVAYPAQRGDLVQQAVISRRSVRRFRTQFGQRQKSQRPQPVIHRHHHHTVPRQGSAVIGRRIGAAAGVASAVEPHHYRLGLLRRPLRRPHIERQTVFACGAKIEILHAGEAELRRCAHAVPALRRFGFAPAQVFHRRGRIRNSQEHRLAFMNKAAQRAVRGLRHGIVLGRVRGQRKTG